VTLLDWLAEHGNVSSHEAAGRTVFWLEDNQMIRVAYYRNVVVHFFVNRSIAEMSLIGAVEDGVRDPEEVKERMLGLRDLLKFEFFFPEKEEFLAAVSDDIAVDVADWEKVLETAGPLGVLARMGQPVAYWALLPFLDAYQIVGDELEATREPYDEKRFLQACLARARLYRIEERLFSAESASQVLFKSALALAANRGLLDDEEEAAPRRGDFASEVRSARSLAASGL
jgi:glycerol-3-phosphate O-acyltransferase